MNQRGVRAEDAAEDCSTTSAPSTGAIVDENGERVELDVFEDGPRAARRAREESDGTRVFAAGTPRRITTSAIETGPRSDPTSSSGRFRAAGCARLSRDGLMAYHGFLRLKDAKGDKSWQAG